MLRLILACFALSCCATLSSAQQTTPEAPATETADDPEVLATETAEDKAAQQDDDAFDEAILDFGKLSGAAYSCIAEDGDLKTHESRVFDTYARLVQLFGTERAFKFAASYGYGTAEENDEKKCAEIIDQFTDKYGVIAQKYDLVTGE